MRFLCSLAVVLVCLQRASSSVTVKHVKCGKLEQYVACPDSCARDDCSKLVEKHPCDPVKSPCKGRCMCKDGYFRNDLNNCVPGALCFKSCDANEEWDDCPDSCDDKRCPVDGIEVQCRPGTPGECIGRCVCKQDFCRDSDKKCVSKDVCAKNSCKANEEFLTNGTACEVTCANQNVPVLCTAQLVAGCFCRKGFIRDESGDCILPKNCPVICNDNEEWKGCLNNCDDVQCPIDGIEVQCRSVKCTNNHEVFGCGSACDTDCATLGKPCPIVNIMCNQKCYCENGYARNKNKVCIPVEKCTTQNSCKANEVFSTCGTSCEETCANRGETTACTDQCISGCFCEKGLIRNASGVCIAPAQCPPVKCTNNHEVFGCGSACDTDCATLGKPCPIVNIMCNRKCYCENGYARDKNKVCIPVEKCTTQNSCEAKEVFSTCGTACEETCANRGETTACTEQCVSGCFCEKGLIRNASGVCIAPAQCPPDPTCGKNEEYKCGSRCVVTCQNRNQQHLSGACVPGCVNSCYCKEGFIRNRNYECVPENQCDVECDINEEWSYCRPQCGDHTCETLDNTPNCSLILPQVCREGCVCAPRFYRNVKGFCVTKTECANQCDSNEDYMTCLGCPPLDCESIKTSYDCNSTKSHCRPGCECADGYLRDFNNICIPGDECPADPQCGENEHYTRCGSKCQNTCDIPQRSCTPRCIPGCVCDEGYIRDEENGKCILATKCPNNCDASAHEVFAPCKRICPPQECGVEPALILCAPQSCIPGCDCEEGFLRAESGGACIPKSECPATQECVENEFLQECPVGCPTDNCQTEITPIPQCLPPFPCQPAKCKCIASYKRNRDGVCVPANKCLQSCNGDKNAEPGCDSCDINCSTYEEHPGKQCTSVPCEEGMCRCKPGFVKDHITELCVLPSDCCGCNGDINAERGWNEDDVDCSNYQNTSLKYVAATSSMNHCKCKAGFIRDPNTDLCVKPENCSPQCKANEDYTTCHFKCPPRTCWSILADIICEPNQTCAPGCTCIPGYMRLDSGLCVPSDQCPQSIPECGKKAYLQECPVDCPTDNCQTEITPIPQCLPPFPCQPANCKCISSYKRNQDGVCVPANECPCNKNETFSECGYEKTCLNMDEETEWDGLCRRGCFCNDEFVRDEDGVCILEKDCPDC